MNPTDPPLSSSSRGSGPLADLQSVPLDPLHQEMFDRARATASGPATLRQRFVADARDLIALAQYSRRLTLHWIDLSAGLRAKFELRGPVPYRPDPVGPVLTGSRSLIGLMYPHEALITAQPGFAFVRILAPRPVWHPNVSADLNQALCLGPSLPAGFPLREIVLMTFGALSLQITQLSRFDPAGLMNPASADWWQQNTHRIPLTREPFIAPDASHAT